jgi:hypothetical protein
MAPRTSAIGEKTFTANIASKGGNWRLEIRSS